MKKGVHRRANRAEPRIDTDRGSALKGSALTLLDADDIRTIVRQEVTAALKPRPLAGSEYVGTTEAARMLGYTERYLPEAIRRQGIPHTRVPGSRKLRFHVPTLRAWMAKHSADSEGGDGSAA